MTFTEGVTTGHFHRIALTSKKAASSALLSAAFSNLHEFHHKTAPDDNLAQNCPFFIADLQIV